MLACSLVAGSMSGVSEVDRALGWKSLDAPGAFRGYRQSELPSKGWSMKDGVLRHEAGGGGGDVITREQFGDFELEVEFKLGAKANSGIMYRVAEKHDATWMTGPEFQLLDDVGHQAKPTDGHSCGALYDLASPPEDKTVLPAGEWNTARIRLFDGVVQHFLNGKKVVDQRVDGPEWKAKIAASKFKDYEGFGVLRQGHLAFQDHGDEVSLRNIRVRRLDEATSGTRDLFNGKDLDGWTFFLADGGKMEDVWSVRDGVLICTGTPAGYIRTKEDFRNYVLTLDWRWNPETKKAGNSGVLVRMIGEDKIWPRSVEAQLFSGRAGDFWNIGDYVMTADPARTNGRNTKHTHAAERPVGEWNHYEIIVNRGDVIVRVNGEELNRATGVEENAGKICLQSEGSEIHFRNVRITPLD
ncbi:MAG: DUF1080 domain-containing protein [Phycisphaerales bacterium]